MLRDIPRVYLLFLVFGLVLMFLVVSYTNNYIRGDDTLTLNDIILTSAVSEIDEGSRINQGSLILKDSFEMVAWETLEKQYPEGSIVKFEYILDRLSGSVHGDFNNASVVNVTSPHLDDLYYRVAGHPDPYYIIGRNDCGDDRNEPCSPTKKSAQKTYKDRPVRAVRVKVHKAGDKVGAAADGWTYSATVLLDAATKESDTR